MRLGFEFVPAAPHDRAPVRHEHGEHDVDGEADADDGGKPHLVVPDEVGHDEPDLDQRRQDRVQREADQRRNAADALVDLARDRAGATLQVIAQRQRMQVAEGLQRQRAHRRLRHVDEEELAQLGEERRRQPQQAVGDDQCHRDDQHAGGRLGRRREPVDDLLQQDRHADRRQLCRHQARQREQHAALVGPQIRQQRAQRLPVVALGARRWQGFARGGPPHAFAPRVRDRCAIARALGAARTLRVRSSTVSRLRSGAAARSAEHATARHPPRPPARAGG